MNNWFNKIKIAATVKAKITVPVKAKITVPVKAKITVPVKAKQLIKKIAFCIFISFDDVKSLSQEKSLSKRFY